MDVARGEANISCLFPEILTIIFQHLSVCDRGRVAQVCTTWRDAAYNRRVWRDVEARLHLRKSSIALFPSLIRRGIVRIQVLSMKRGLKDVICGVPGLQTVNLSGCYNITDTTLEGAIATALPSITQLNLSLCKSLTDSSVERVSQFLPNLTELNIAGCSFVTANGLMYIAWGLSNLKLLNLRSCRQVSDRGVGNICGHNVNVTGAKGNLQLETLILQDCQKLSDQALKHISTGLPKLKVLNLSFCCRVTDSGVRYLAKMPSLRKLDVQMCQNISDIGIGYLAEGSARLSHLDVSFCERITDDSLIHISQGLFQLQSLSMCNCNITDEGISKMVRTSHDMDTLNIGQCKHVTDVSLQDIANYLKKLKAIDLYGCLNITKHGLHQIMQLPKMKTLNRQMWQQS